VCGVWKVSRGWKVAVLVGISFGGGGGGLLSMRGGEGMCYFVSEFWKGRY
jgi:hypothetical protein